MADRTKGNGDSTGAGSQIAFDYIKSQQFRVIRADGAIGGITPSGMIHFALYSERHPIPRRLVHAIDESGQLGDVIESEKISRDAIVREMDVDIFLSATVARSLHDWLGKTLGEHQERLGSKGGQE